MRQQGIASIVSVIILGSLMVLIGGLMVLTAISKGQIALTQSQSQQTKVLLDACAEESLLTINENNTLPSTIITTLGRCSITINSQVGTSWNYKIGANGDVSSLGVNIALNRGTTLAVSTWLDQ
jgi:hypothetical protein